MTKPQTVTIAVDAMSGDAGAEVIVEASLQILQKYAHVHLLLAGDVNTLSRCLSVTELPEQRYTVIPSTDVVTMEDSAAVAMRQKKNSSMRVAINQVKDGKAAACVSAGNTGALMAISRFVLKTMPGIDRPAIIKTMPGIDGHTYVLDLGANVDCTAEHLLQFAVMGSTLASAVEDLPAPRVGLLNIGSEDIKGNEQIKQAATLLSESDMNYIGFVEGNEIFSNRVDVVVCDGFVGNVALKTSEGLAKLVSHYLREEFKRTWLNKIIALVAMPVLKAFRSRIDPRKYNGASLVGLQGVVIKSHGGADAVAFANAMEIAIIESSKNVPSLIGERVQQQLPVV